MPRDVRRARLAVALLFLTNGAIFANILPRYPAIKESLDLSNAQFGIAVAAFPLGALLAGLAAGALIRRFRSSRVAVFGTVLTAVGVLLAAVSPSWAFLSAALLLAGAMDAITDVAQNSHGLRVQRLYGRSILNSFHAVWSIGAVAGGLMGGAAAALEVPLAIHLGASAVLFCAVSIGCYRLLLAGPEPLEVIEETPVAASVIDGVPVATGAATGGAAVPRRPSLGRLARWIALFSLVMIAAAGAIVEDSGSTWAAIYLSGDLGASVGVAAFGFVALVGAQFIGRLLGDRLVDRFGQRAVARAGGILVAVGMGAALLFPSVPGTILGFAAAGLGVATLVPAAMHEADQLPGLRAGTGLTVVSWLLRVGFLLSPPIVGFIADASGLRFGLIIVPVVGVIVVLFSGVLSTRLRLTDNRA